MHVRTFEKKFGSFLWVSGMRWCVMHWSLRDRSLRDRSARDRREMHSSSMHCSAMQIAFACVLRVLKAIYKQRNTLIHK
jgi:hypothetical protein